MNNRMDIEIDKWLRGDDSFSSRLFSLINKADRQNRHKLKMTFPEHVSAWEEWYDQRS